MSVAIMSRVFNTEFDNLTMTKKDKVITVGKPVAKLVMLSIADSADEFGENSYQSFETLAKKSSVERRSVIRIVQVLIANDYLKLGGVSRYGTNDYHINCEKLGYAPTKRAQNGRPKTSDSRTPVVFPSDKTSDSGAETSDSGAETGDSGVTRSVLNPPLPIKSAGEKTAPATRRTDAKIKGDGFDFHLDYGRAALDEPTALAAKIAEYPPELQDILKWCCSAWGWSASAIPGRPVGKKKLGAYGEWIEELYQARTKMDGFGEDVIISAAKACNGIVVSRPRTMLWSIPGIVGQLRKKRETTSPTYQPSPFELAMSSANT